MPRPRKKQPGSPAEPTWPMVVLAPFWTLGSDRVAHQGDRIEASAKLRATLLFKGAARDA